MADAKPMNCRELVERATDYLEGTLSAAERARAEQHLAGCPGCGAYLQQMRALAQILGRQPVEPIAPGTKERLLGMFREHRLARATRAAATIPLGVGDQFAASGDHIAYFWESEEQFAASVGFLEVGLRGRDFCVVFGYEAANQKVLDFLRARGFDTDKLIAARRLAVVGGGPSGATLLAGLGDLFQSAVKGGAPVIRLLGNLGWGRPGWPEEKEILEFEARVTRAAREFPCVIVCAYDVRALSGHILLQGGFETHPLTVRDAVLQENPFYVPLDPFVARLSVAPGTSRVQ